MEKIDLENICQKLQVDRRSKILALEELQKFCENPKPEEADVLAVFDECYLHILKCYSDHFQSVRDQAAHTVSQFIERLPPNDFHLSNIIATLVERMGRDETVEESEEIRLMYIQQINSLLSHYPRGNEEVLQELYDSIGVILKKAIRDPHPAIKREACAAIVSLALSAKRSVRFQNLADCLAKSLYCILNHKHSLVRIAAIEALGRLALHVDCSGDALSRLIMEVSPLLMDSMPLVRRECGQMGILLLMELNDRYSYFDRIIPLILCCLKDESPEVIAYIQPLWVKCGEQYFEENETELSKQEISDLKPENYPDGIERPTIGCRALVQRSLRLLTLITKESADWKDNVRLHSLRLLYQFVLHAESAMTAKFFEIYPDVARACRDYEHTVSSEAMKVSDLMGRLFRYEDWFEHGFEGFSKNAREGYLKCFYAMFNATSFTNVTEQQAQDLLRISEVLTSPNFSQSLKPVFQKYVIKLADSVLLKAQKINTDHVKKTEIEKNTFVAVMKVFALAHDTDLNKNSEIRKKFEKILQSIVKRQEITLSELYEKYIEDVLKYVNNLDVQLDGLSEPILLLNGIITVAKFRAPYLNQLQEKILEVWETCSSDAKIKVFAVISIEIMLWPQTINKNLEESARLLEDFLKTIVEQHLAWKVGTTAEAMRSLAAATICSISQGAPEEAKLVLPHFAKYIPSLLEDHSIRTRHYAIKCLLNFGEIPIDDLKPIAYGALQRLDDPSNDIRILAATCIPQLRPKLKRTDGNIEESDSWKTFLKKSLDVLIIHYEGPDCRLKEHIRGVIMELARKHPDIVTDCFKRANEQFYNTSILQQELINTLGEH